MKGIVLAIAIALSLSCWGLNAQNEKGYDPEVFALESGRGELSKEYFGVKLSDVKKDDKGQYQLTDSQRDIITKNILGNHACSLLHKTYEYWHPIYHWESSCQGTVPQAIIAFLDSSDFEDAIRKAVSLGGDSDTLACITGGIAEAFYKEIPRRIAERVARKFPVIFNKILESVREQTVYGNTCKIVD